MCKEHLFLGTKAIFLSFLILAASATLVVAARASNLMEPKTGSNDTDFSKYNRPIAPSGPNPCSYMRGPGHCQPPKLIKTMVSSGCKRSLSLRAKAIFLLLLILVARADLVDAARPSDTMTKKPRFGASSTHFPQSNRPVPPSAPNPCSYIPGQGECKPPK
ncbi:hypothetical protein POTOM_024294 [Populus tomentosa]|uniref:Uncharacterized protein n=1 Tax=Populus tomentosa TaxID=118781 RepID=A0A8X7ZK55_POPTO|nr:hypothetical protein POTOM_024294 [Populus tomentosa]